MDALSPPLSARSARKHWVVHVLLPLLVGGSIYVFFRSQSLLMFRWSESLHIMPGIRTIRGVLSPIGEALPDLLLYSAPDGAWLYAYVSFYRLVWAGHSRSWMWTWIGIGLFLSIGLEIFQALGWARGTFDWMDLAIYALATLIAVSSSLPDDDPAPATTDPLDR